MSDFEMLMVMISIAMLIIAAVTLALITKRKD